MKNLNRSALLQKNPQVNGPLLEEQERKIEEARKLAGKKLERPVTSPYGGRRLIPDRQETGRADLDIRRSSRSVGRSL